MQQVAVHFYQHKRLDCIVEAGMANAIAAVLDRSGVSGFSVLPILQGKGKINAWNSDGQVSDSANMLVFMCIVDGAKANDTIKSLMAAMQGRSGLLTVSDVLVCRSSD
jgi:hypothetical protein